MSNFDPRIQYIGRKAVYDFKKEFVRDSHHGYVLKVPGVTGKHKFHFVLCLNYNASVESESLVVADPYEGTVHVKKGQGYYRRACP